jgi:hypothetical protein
LACGRIKIPAEKCRQLLDEWMTLPWNDDHTDHRDGFADHCSDAALYAFRKHPIREMLGPQLGPESTDAHNERVRNQLMQSAMKRSSNGKRW